MHPLIQAVLIGLLYWLARINIGYTFTTRWAYVPMVMAVPIGLIMGDLTQAVIMGAFIQAVYIGLVSGLGGVMTVDKALAPALSIPIAIKAGMSPELAVTMAIPFGLLGTAVVNVFKAVMSYFNHLADRAAAEGDAKKIRRLAYVYPPLVWLPLAVIPVTLIVFLGPDAVRAVLNRIPESVLHGLAVAGGMLPALGFTMTVRTIGRKSLLPFFLAGYFLIKYFGLTTIGAAIFGTIIAVLYTQLKRGDNVAV